MSSSTFCRSPHERIVEDLNDAENTLVDLEDAGFKLDWLKMKLWEVYVKKKLEQESSARIRELQEEVQKQKLVFFYFENQLKNEKNVAMAVVLHLISAILFKMKINSNFTEA